MSTQRSRRCEELPPRGGKNTRRRQLPQAVRGEAEKRGKGAAWPIADATARRLRGGNARSRHR
eukprot:352682-Chlamydomonas_euryale.AAC.3